ncbi:hypothetical protein ACP6EF_32415, partial [Klebsiella pneumoniae subsp. pneumoniae]
IQASQLVVKIGVAKTGVTIDSVFQADPNKQPYSHSVKLQDGRSVRIRLFALYEVSGSVPR